jgi:hypothetical protein
VNEIYPSGNLPPWWLIPHVHSLVAGLVRIAPEICGCLKLLIPMLEKHSANRPT